MPLHVPPATCKALIRRSIDLRQLYRHAAAACEPGLRLVLDENAHTLDLLVADVQAQLGADAGTPHWRESWRGALRRHAIGWLAHVASRREAAWIHALMHHESALLCTFEKAITATSGESALVLRRQLPRLRGIYLDMHSLAGDPRY